MDKFKLIISAVDKFSKPFKRATAMIGKLGSMAKGVGKVIGGLGLAVTAAAAAFVALGKKAFDALDDIGKTAGRTGIATDKIQALRLAAVESGGTIEGLNKSIEKFAKNVGDVVVKGTGEASYALDRMGITLRNNNGVLKSNDDLLTEIVGGIGKVGSEAERASLLMSFFGREGIKLNQVFGQGQETFDKWITTAQEMGFVVSGKSIAAIESFNDRFAELQFLVSGLINQSFAALAPVLDTLIISFKDFAVEAQKSKGGLEKLGQEIATKFLDSVISLIRFVGEAGETLINFAIKSTNGLKQMGLAALLIAQVVSKNLRGAVETLQDLLNNTNPELSNFAETANKAADKLEKLKGKIGAGETPIAKIGNDAGEAAEKIDALAMGFNKFGAGFAKVANESTNKFEDLELLGEAVGKKLETSLVDAFMNIRTGAEGLKDAMDQILKQIIAELIRVTIVQSIVGSVTGFFGFGGARENGGPVTGGKTYLVGESGPELFTAPGNGNIVPNNKLAMAVDGMMGSSVNVISSIFGKRENGGPVTGGRPYLVGEQGPELFVPGQSGGIVPNNGLAMAGAGGGSTNINITYDIKAFDAKDATAAIAEQAPTIVGIVEQSFRKRGKRGPLG